jgi:hypothetical protein
MSITRNKLYNAIIASKINTSNQKNTKQLSSCNILLPYTDTNNNNITLYHLESFYRDNSNDKYELSNKK